MKLRLPFLKSKSPEGEEKRIREATPPQRERVSPPRPSLFSPSILTFSIEGGTLRFTVSRGLQIEAWASVPFNTRFLRGGLVADAFGIGQVIRNTLSLRKFPTKRVVCALPGHQSSTRILTLPPAARSNLDTLITREARRQLAISADSHYLRWQTLTSRGGPASGGRFYVVSVPKEPLRNLLTALSNAGLRPRTVDLKTLALARAANRKDAVVVNSESNSLDLVVVVDDVPVLTRSLYLGEEPTMSEYSRLTEELARTLVFYNDSNRENPLDTSVPIYLTGDLTDVSEIAETIYQSTGHPVPPLTPPVRQPPDFPTAKFMVNIGLLLKVL